MVKTEKVHGNGILVYLFYLSSSLCPSYCTSVQAWTQART